MKAVFPLEFYRGKRVFVTGHTGFKGSWLCHILKSLGAEVTGYALEADAPSLFRLARVTDGMRSVCGDIRDKDAFETAFRAAKPEIVFHLAAQPLVREGYRAPLDTYATNVMGTVHLLECMRRVSCVRSFVNVTTDKVYENGENPCREGDRLGGKDPYSCSKSCSELLSESYRASFFAGGTPAVSTARAGNVIGGGDFAADRILPDCVRAMLSGKPLVLRNPRAVRPYQHVLEALFAYLMIAARQYEDGTLAGSYNVGPDAADCVTTEKLVALFAEAWGKELPCRAAEGGPRETETLRLDCAKLQSAFGWHPTWDLPTAVRHAAAWYKAFAAGEDVVPVMDAQIADFINN